jgi:hypothetical protein
MPTQQTADEARNETQTEYIEATVGVTGHVPNERVAIAEATNRLLKAGPGASMETADVVDVHVNGGGDEDWGISIQLALSVYSPAHLESLLSAIDHEGDVEYAEQIGMHEIP